MKAVATSCSCQWQVTPEIRLCPACHRYYKGSQEFVSVSKVIKTLLPADYKDIDPVVLEIARLRGTYVDQFFSEWLADPNGVLALPDVEAMIAPRFPRDGAKHAEDTIVRIDMLLDWWIGKGWKATAVQKTVYSEADGVAGTMDLATKDFILDVKCVAKLQPSYELQVGAYLDMDEQEKDGGVIHVTKDNVRLIPYNPQQAKHRWKSCLDWFNCRQEMIGS